MPNKKQEPPKESKLYDSTLKALFSELAEEIIPCLLTDAYLPEGLTEDELNVELNRNTLSMDVGRPIVFKGYSATFNLEVQSSSDDDLLPRMLEYAINLYRRYHRPTVSVALLLFECAVPEVPFRMGCGEVIFSIFSPIIICMWLIDPQEVVDRHQRCLYTLLPTMKKPTVELLTQALQEMDECDTRPLFIHHLTWFQTMLRRTTTISKQDKQKIEEVLRMQYKSDTLLREDPVIHSLIVQGELKGEIKGEIKGIQDSILAFVVSDRFSPQVVAHVQQTIAPSQDTEQLKNFLRQLFRVSDEQEIYVLLAQCFPLPGEVKGIQDSILAFVSDRFSPQVVEQVQQTIAPSQDVQQLKNFLRQLFRASDEQEVYAQLAQCFPIS